MKFKIISHACLLVESQGKRLLVDPWLTGSVYWGSWWLNPPAVVDQEVLNPDFVYITHWHIDHFHIDSLKLINKKAKIYVSKFPISPLPQQLRELGFSEIIEMDQATTHELVPGFKITPYQVQIQDDSVLAIDCDGTILLDVNDAKPLPSTWRMIKKRFPKIDFLFRSHSSAWSYPTCFEFERPEDAIPVSRETYKSGFWDTMAFAKPRYAVPFASGICHLHRESLSNNTFLVPSFEMVDYMKSRPIEGVETVYMPPGSSWSARSGFGIAPTPRKDLSESVKQLAQEHQAELQELYRQEDQAQLSFQEFKKYFTGLMSTTFFIRKLFVRSTWDLIVDFPATNRIAWWRLDFAKGQVSEVQPYSEGSHSQVRIHAAVLKDAMSLNSFTNIDIAKRWQVKVKTGCLIKHLMVMNLISLWEGNYFNWRRLLSYRFIRGVLLRWPEVLDQIIFVLKMALKGGRASLDAMKAPDKSKSSSKEPLAG